MQTRFAKQAKLVQKPIKSIQGSTNVPSCQTSCQKQDKPNYANITTYHKLNLSLKENQTITKCTTIRSNSHIDKFKKVRSVIVNSYSKIQYFYNTTMETLFLAIDIFDKFIQKNGQQVREDIEDIALACFMIAAKYEEIYPPTLTQVQSKMKNWISFNKYMEKQFQILGKLQYNLTMQSPLQYFKQFPGQMTDEKKSFVYLYLELVALNQHIKRQYTWNDITKAVKILFEPLTQVLQAQNQQKVRNCLKSIMVQRVRLSEAYIWINKKYSQSRFHCVAKKPCYLGDNF